MRQSKSSGEASTFHTIVLYALGFLLLWEWLRPIEVLTDTSDVQIFVMYTAFLFIVTYFQFPFYISFPVKLLALLYALHSMYFPDVFLSFRWFPYFMEDVKTNIGFIADRDWDSMTSLSRSFLFFILLWIVSYLMHYWLVQTKRIFFFFFLTILYITVLDTFAGYDATVAIVRVVFIGLVLTGILRMMKIIEAEGFSLLKGKFPILWMMPLTVVIAFSSFLGYIAPKAEPQWPDPVSFITKSGEGEDEGEGLGGKGVSKIGYGTNDSRLGGPFEFDYTPVFTVKDTGRHYWKVETKETYTGKGWETSKGQQQIQIIESRYEPSSQLVQQLEDGVKTEDHKALVTGEKIKYPFVLNPGKLQSVDIGDENDLYENIISGKLYTKNGDVEVLMDQYELNYQLPVLKEEEVKKSGNAYPAYIKDNYLQLPSTLPNRVKTLAQSIMKDKPTIYDKVKAVEGYFELEGYGYNTVDVKVPKKDEDYVDQFLFETRIGYCDNFSSSMVVMLRSAGIPARWAKGFTQGEIEEVLEDGMREFTVTNANAHSWVEVYFQGIGWLPFEPTRGFSNPSRFETDTSSTPAAAVPKPEKKPEKVDTETDTPDEKSSNVDMAELGRKIAMFAGSTILAGLALGFLFRKKWMREYVLWRFKRKKGADTFPQAFEKLVWLLNFYGIKRQPAYTLREYALHVDRALDTKDMKILAKAYENLQYSGRENHKDYWTETNRKLWENLIKRIRP
ncbi:DUF4129 domain-containing transglutaminase family protein [Fictibacillus aquaticus]|uniref:Transglutaminase-like domain-containing protein n=1 Tax=Fictibacillus aquaticus TaxID=2021314 RepID=A0A235F610_9BACL|nr:transglutaminase domain-containing protein [Fictibacillus aquaticus]OYD56367.1 hypothetical protein CGZ90_17585 [Fictibacillus aquaticus]